MHRNDVEKAAVTYQRDSPRGSAYDDDSVGKHRAPNPHRSRGSSSFLFRDNCRLVMMASNVQREIRNDTASLPP